MSATSDLERPRAAIPIARAIGPKVLLPALALALAALGYTAYRAYLLPWTAYGEEDMGYLGRVDPRSLSGGDLTHYHTGRLAFGLPAPNLAWGWFKRFDDGDGLFERVFDAVRPVAPDSEADGLGPLYNHNACGACHVRDGRAQPRTNDPGAPQEGLLIRLSVPGTGPHGGPKPHPVYGGQLADRALAAAEVGRHADGVPRSGAGAGGLKPEGRVLIRYQEIPGQYPDGTPYCLTRPSYALVALAGGPLGEDTAISPRVAPAVHGQGLLEAIPEASILADADPSDQDGDGISGRPQWTWHPAQQRLALGRFGWKSETASLAHQAMDAALNDMGLSNPLFPDQPCTQAQVECRAARHGDSPEGPELSRAQMDQLVVYLQLLGVPARRGVTEEKVLQGERAFRTAGCSRCHRETFVTAGHGIARLNGQTIHPYTDLLLHDLGEALSDGRPAYAAAGNEWRTAPLWGIGLVPIVNGHQRYLHDGRARGLEEAILWHGGEAQPARDHFMGMAKAEREALLFFLESL